MIFGFGGKKRFYFRVFDDALRKAGLHPATMDDAFRLTVWRWVEEEIASGRCRDENPHYSLMEAVARLAAFAMLEPEESREQLPAEALAAVTERLDRVLDDPETDGLDNRVIRLVLATGRANRTIAERVELDVEG